jgi:threonine dehydratase
MAVALRHINPRIKIFGVEAAAMPGMKRSLERGAVERVLKQPTMADGIAIEHVGQIPFEIIKETVDDIVTVEEDEIAAAVLALLEKEKTVLEGSGATGVAALLSNKIKLEEGSNVGIVLTGGNIDMTLLGRIIEKGLVKTGRLARVRVTVSDMPGQLASVCTAIASLGGNIRDIMHERAFLLDTVQYTQPVITIETRDFAHITAILDKLREGAFRKVKLETPEP